MNRETLLPKRCPHCGRLLHRLPDGGRWCATDIRHPQTGEMLGCGHTEGKAK